MAQLILVRHGESQWNLENKFTGWVDVELTLKGIQEAKDAGEKLRPYRFDQAFTSGLKRAQETLRLILEVTGQTDLSIERDLALNERMYGDLQGLNKSETVEKFGEAQVKIWRRSYDIPPPGGESLKDTAERVLPYYERRIHPEVLAGKTILIAAHGNSLRSLVM
ncbi:MAG: 2,3-bisphosphoglycerate-dependent phosphoglycerate mutase, partial [Nitrospirales bacterium]